MLQVIKFKNTNYLRNPYVVWGVCLPIKPKAVADRMQTFVLTSRTFLLIILAFPITSSDQQLQGEHDFGYVLFCPCMGRFGNQMEQFLGVLAFAKHLNRTLVLPPLVEYPPHSREARMREFDTLFRVEPLAEFHRVMPMRHFMREIASKIWRPENRTVFCWAPRTGLTADPNLLGCHATEGNPFGPFWRHVGVLRFSGEQFFGDKTGDVDTESEGVRQRWINEFPPSQFPVLAFSSAPAAFPVQQSHRWLQRFIQWTGQIEAEADEIINSKFGGKGEIRLVAVHLRNGPDWENACRHLDDQTSAGGQLFASAQCTGYSNEYGQLSAEACNPSLGTVLEEIQSQVRRVGATAVFVASDWRNHLETIRAHLAEHIPWPIDVASAGSDHGENAKNAVAVDLAILARAHHFIGNCASTFSAFVVRQRLFGTNHQQQPQPSRSCSFFGFPKAASELLGHQQQDGFDAAAAKEEF